MVEPNAPVESMFAAAADSPSEEERAAFLDRDCVADPIHQTSGNLFARALARSASSELLEKIRTSE